MSMRGRFLTPAIHAKGKQRIPDAQERDKGRGCQSPKGQIVPESSIAERLSFATGFAARPSRTPGRRSITQQRMEHAEIDTRKRGGRR